MTNLTPALLGIGTKRMRALLDGPVIKVGQRVTLKDEDAGPWDVLEVGQPIRRDAVKRGWNNNI